MAKPKPTKPTLRETKLIKGIISGKTQQQAGIEAGYGGGPKTVSVTASQALQKPHVREALQQEMERQGITLEKIVKPIKDGLEAEKVSIVGNGEDAMAEITPDHTIRLKSSQMAQKLIGVDIGDGGTTNNFIQVINQKADKYAD